MRLSRTLTPSGKPFWLSSPMRGDDPDRSSDPVERSLNAWLHTQRQYATGSKPNRAFTPERLARLTQPTRQEHRKRQQRSSLP